MVGRSHPLPMRIAHWIHAVAFGLLVASGLAIWSAYPYFGPPGATYDALPLQGIELRAMALAPARQLHLAVAWLFVLNALAYAGVLAWRRRYRRFSTSDVYSRRDRIAYVAVLALGAIEIASGFALWKPVQLYWLAALFGGYDVARVVHYYAMLALVGFTLAHAAIVAVRWRRR